MVDAAAVFLLWIPLGLMVYNWFLFPVLLLGMVKLRRRAPVVDPTDWDLPHVTVVIAAHNEEQVIGQKILNCLGFDYPPDRFDILVASDGSDDATDSVVRSVTDPRVQLFRQEPRAGKASALNLAMREVKGELVLFTDADVMIAQSALLSMVERFRDDSVGVVHAHYHRLNKGGNPAEGFFDRYEAKVKYLEGQLGAMVGAYGWALMLRKPLCEPIPEDTILDDFVLGIRPLRKGYSVVYEPEALCWTKVEEEGVEFKRKVRISRGNVQAFLRCADLLNPKYGIRAWVLFSHKFLRWITPFLLLMILAVSAVKIGAPFFFVLFLVQALLYVTAPLVVVVRGSVRKWLIPQYYLFQNFALLLGYWQYSFCRRGGHWQRTARSDG